MKTSEETEIRASEWIARQDRRELSAEERRSLDRWLDESPAHRVAYLRLESAWVRAERLRALQSRSATRPMFRWTDVLARWAAAPTRRSLSMLASGCAAALVAIVWSIWPARDGLRDYSTPIGAREVVVLADGSKLTLNTSTRLSTIVDAHERTVWLKDGEAFFDVAHDASRPFVIVVDRRRIVVTGTMFSVRRDGERLDVTVLEGRVQVQSEDTPLTLISKNESAIGVGANVLVTPQSEAHSRAAVGWLQGRLFFDQMTLADAAAQFNRYNRKKIVIADLDAGNIRIGGSFEAANVDAFARLVQTGFGLVIRETGNTVTIASAR